jgi:RNase P/RNase MRP subunit POP5
MDYLSSQEAIGYAHLHSILLRKSHKIMLGYHNTPLAYDWLKANRFRLWTRILRAKEEDYTHLLNNLDTIANKNNDEIITLDVHRSF